PLGMPPTGALPPRAGAAPFHPLNRLMDAAPKPLTPQGLFSRDLGLARPPDGQGALEAPPIRAGTPARRRPTRRRHRCAGTDARTRPQSFGSKRGQAATAPPSTAVRGRRRHAG